MALPTSMKRFVGNTSGAIAIQFGLVLMPLLGLTGAAVDFHRASGVRTQMQNAADATALAVLKDAPRLSLSQMQSSAEAFFKNNFKSDGRIEVSIQTTYEASLNIVSVTATSNIKPDFLSMVGIGDMPVSATAKATNSGKIWPVCVLVTAPRQNHVLMSLNQSQIRFNNCMVQVNTLNWDAVEARSVSSIISTNGENCFVGDIHYGNIQPPKNPSCTFFPDPFANMTAPTGGCSFTNLTVSQSTLRPGVYCGNTSIPGGNVTLEPGLYIVKDGNFSISGNAVVNAQGVTFVMTGIGPNFSVGGSAQLNLTATTSGPYAGFAFFFDRFSNMGSCDMVRDGSKMINGKKNDDCVNYFTGNSVSNITGIMYYTNTAFFADQTARVNITGSIIADVIVSGNSAVVSLEGALPNSTAIAAQMQKASENSTGRARLIQ